ncbi:MULTISPECIES: AfsA-related hotdog domain-containing protein [Delftia]|uniref:AfsA-related hotdog domain-containing protein n=1 Tax=Delftia sp. UME58 TaxID=1862322 RepID=UPI0016002C74|nr:MULTISPECIES: AfsA-related hotdog domain-containing protein [Delftia]
MVQTIYVVGNKFHEFGKHESVKTLAEICEMIRTSSFDGLPAGTRIAPGQGLREADVQALHDHGLWSLAAHGVDVSPTLLRPSRASRVQTHKHHFRNSIISHPERIGNTHYRASLLLDERSELMGDHQTGQHIQGMVLVEAARQMFLAVTEEYFIGDAWVEPYYFVINEMSANFSAFVFPVEATLDYHIRSHDVANASRLAFDVTTSIFQAGEPAMEISFQFTAYHASRIKEAEDRQARKLLASLNVVAGAQLVDRPAGTQRLDA